VLERITQRREELTYVERQEAEAKRELAALAMGVTLEERRNVMNAVRACVSRPDAERYAARAKANQAFKDIVDEIRCRCDGRLIVRTGGLGSLVTLAPDGATWDVWRQMERIAA
jgi:hypothetical protein